MNLSNKECTNINGAGKVSISVDKGSDEYHVVIKKVFDMSNLRATLLSVAKMTDRRIEVNFKKNIEIDDKNKFHMLDHVGNL